MNATRLLSILQACLLGAVVVAHAMIHIIAIQWPTFGGATWTLVVEAALMAQVAILILWAGLGPGAWWMRTVGIVAGLTFLAAADHFEHTYYDQDFMLYEAITIPLESFRVVPLATLLSMAGSQAAVLLAAIILLRRRGQTLTYVGLTEPVGQPFRFSLRSLMILVALAAVIAKVALTVRAASADALPVPQVPAVAFTAVPAALAVLLTVWAVSAPGSFWQRLPVLLVGAPALGTIGPLVCGRDTDLLTWVQFTSFEAALVAGTLYALRLAGYRLSPVKTREPQAVSMYVPQAVAGSPSA